MDETAVRIEDVGIAARDGYALAATTFVPPSPPVTWIVVNPATAVPRTYYARFARFLAGQGLAAVTYDYRGIGGSRPALLGYYSGARVEQRALTPQDLGVKAIGHWGFFRERFRDPLWHEAADWLRSV